MVYKLVRAEEWQAAEKEGTFLGSPDDVRDGYLHFSAAGQLRATAERHFAGENGLLLLTVEVSRLGSALRWEPSRKGEKFPHLYSPLQREQIARVERLARGADGRLVFPPDIPK